MADSELVVLENCAAAKLFAETALSIVLVLFTGHANFKIGKSCAFCFAL